MGANSLFFPINTSPCQQHYPHSDHYLCTEESGTCMCKSFLSSRLMCSIDISTLLEPQTCLELDLSFSPHTLCMCFMFIAYVFNTGFLQTPDKCQLSPFPFPNEMSFFSWFPQHLSLSLTSGSFFTFLVFPSIVNICQYFLCNILCGPFIHFHLLSAMQALHTIAVVWQPVSLVDGNLWPLLSCQPLSLLFVTCKIEIELPTVQVCCVAGMR